MGVTSAAYSVSPKLLAKLRKDNELFGTLFGEVEDPAPEWKVDSHEFLDFEDTHRLVRLVGYRTLQDTLDFSQGNDEAYDYDGWDIQVASPAKVKKIATELAKVTLEELRAKGLENEFRTDRRSTLLKPEDYETQFEEVRRAAAFFAAAAAAGNAVVAGAM